MRKTTIPMPRMKSGEGNDPGDVVETAANGSGEHGGAVLGDEPVEDAAVGQAGGDFGAELVDLAVGVGAADVVALEEDLAAAADAHELVADGVEARGGCAGAEHGDSEDADQCDVEEALTHGEFLNDEREQTQIPPLRYGMTIFERRSLPRGEWPV